ncbi:MAG: polysaccharide pyruvyl transferase family protein [Candidatus Competibacteraceae bacterium]|nr:polysaccharide pyruvyl transferase family protein [Candidatus Competibacteraceae bacterium]
MKVLLINDSTSNPNWGDRAAATALKLMINKLGGDIIDIFSEDELKCSSFLRSEIGVKKSITGDRRLTELLKLFFPPILFKIKGKMLRSFGLEEKPCLIPDTWDEFRKCAENILNNKERYQRLINVFDKMDVAVIHGDGCMVGNGLLPRTELFLGYLIKTHFNKPVVIVNHTADFDHPNLLKIAQKVYPLFDDVVFRDPISEKRCKEFCNGRFVADTAFLFEPILSTEFWKDTTRRPTYFDIWPDVAAFDPAKPYLCIGGSSILSYDSFPLEIIKDFSLLIRYIQSIYPGQIVLTVSDIVDQPVFRTIAKELALPLVGLATPVQQVVDIIGNAEAYIGGRWHPSIFALRGGTPIIPLSAKTFKMQALIEMAGLNSITFDALGLDKIKYPLGNQLYSYLEQGVDLRKKIRIWAQEAAKNCWGNIEFLKKPIKI